MMQFFTTKEDFKYFLERKHKEEKISIWIETKKLKYGTRNPELEVYMIYANIHKNKPKHTLIRNKKSEYEQNTPHFCLGTIYHSKTDAEKNAKLFKEHIGIFDLQPNEIK